MSVAGIFRPALGVASRTAIVIVLVLAVLVAWLTGPIEALARGWLLAFSVWSCVPVGSLVLLMIHRLVGGRWGEALAPVLRPAACLVPLVLLAFIPIAVALPAIYPWVLGSDKVTPFVARIYLNEPAFLLRAAVALVGWSILGLIFGLGRGGRLLAGLGLAFYGLTISLVAVDWYLSLTPAYVSTAFAAMIAIQQLLGALVVAALISPAGLDGQTWGDLGGWLLATMLGVVYLELMIFVIAWYGDQADRAEWYLDRVAGGWLWALLAVVLLGAVVPFALLLRQRVRRSGPGLRVVGALLAFGTVLHFAWLIAPSFSPQSGPLVSACVIGIGLFLASAMVVDLVPGTRQERAAYAG